MRWVLANELLAAFLGTQGIDVEKLVFGIGGKMKRQENLCKKIEEKREVYLTRDRRG